MPDPIDLSHILNLPPEEVIAYFESKGYEISWNWWETWQQAHDRAFTVAKVVRADILQDIREEVTHVFGDPDYYDGRGITEREFIKRLEPRLKAKGWWGRQIVVDPDGGAEVVQLGSPWRLKHIYRQNAQSAYNAGRLKSQRDNADHRPWWQYIAVNDSRTRHTHAELHGKVFRLDDPITDWAYPPNDHGCRCRGRALSQRRLEAEGLTPEDTEGKIGEREAVVGLDKRTGEQIRVNVPTYGEFSPGAGFAHAPGADGWIDSLLTGKRATLDSDLLDALTGSLQPGDSS